MVFVAVCEEEGAFWQIKMTEKVGCLTEKA